MEWLVRSLFRVEQRLISVDELLDRQLQSACSLQNEWDRHVPVYVQEEHKDEWLQVA